MTTFADLGLSQKVLSAVTDAGYTTPTPIQEGAIPPALERRDILGIAQTGTGKTAGFVLPMLTMLERGRARARMPRTLILEPTRELAAQVHENFEKYGKNHRLNIVLLIGGVSFDEQDRKLERGADVLIATPGRLLDHTERGKLLMTGVEILVIDEADRMLDMGFIPDIERIVKFIPFTRQTLFFSATMPPEIQKLADTFLQNPVRIEVAPPSSTAATVVQRLVACGGKDFEKRERLRDLIRSQTELTNAIIFCNRKKDVAELYKSLEKHGFSVGALHGDMDQRSRTNMLQGFKDNEITLLVASDVAARGLDIPAVSHVFNFDVPIHAEDYVHRIGRTGRAGRAGASFTMVTRRDAKYVDAITKLIDREIEWLDGKDAINASSDESDDKPGRGRRTDSKGTARRSGRDDKRPRGEKPAPVAAEETIADIAASADPVETAAKPAHNREERQPRDERPARQDREERQPKPAREERPARQEREERQPRQRAPEPANANDDRNRGRSRHGRDNDDRENTPVGFGDEIPAFMMIGS
ncbi:MAG: DEAD/DEAH box helicase [Hoeflea sp.]|uniref:DEAD/DEAH box helicase n=1 Tax=Hoeflea sp. TaxID=1940281 RepID=UPI001E19E50A|nr:DEAD/DEAH box helicase [Hoeflea sp.]MBU4530369.1 DEAD/DEAH box helicase [Alphaproteobacteria bacterium]MBU4545156.1 DEAD/DEAH box helicase [Alphaproteobacteria bacterium]MBU4549644.1 DEAD/DEAH box helicase [Alphaproteobacteria bacterium]MBV1721959.1 DEAD/DEAH box helicase [Hoeflea sp.]MBV1761309.1 DEAD/DEAH box helicase [Hoeflea sp.]